MNKLKRSRNKRTRSKRFSKFISGEERTILQYNFRCECLHIPSYYEIFNGDKKVATIRCRFSGIDIDNLINRKYSRRYEVLDECNFEIDAELETDENREFYFRKAVELINKAKKDKNE